MSDPSGLNFKLSFLKETKEGVIISLSVKPRSSRDAIEGLSPEGLLKVRVTSAPVKGAANKGVIKLLSKSIGVPKTRLTIVSGEKFTRKGVLVEGISAEAVVEWWDEISRDKARKKDS